MEPRCRSWFGGWLLGGGVNADIRLSLCPSCDVTLRRVREMLESAVLVYMGKSIQEALPENGIV